MNKLYFLSSMLFTLMIIVVITNNPGLPTGYATFATKDQVLSKINSISADSSMQLLAPGTAICAVVEVDNETTYYYKLAKIGDSMDVTEQYCADPEQDILILKFNSYDELASASQNPKLFITEKRNTGYVFFPSNYVTTGGNVQCTASFQQKYCVALYKYFTSSEIAGTGLACCANYELTAAQKAKIQEIKTGKKSTTESPMDFLFSTTGIIIVIIVIIAIVIVSSLVVMRPKHTINPLLEYVTSTRMQGYSDEDIKNSLKDSGWDDKTIADALK